MKKLKHNNSNNECIHKNVKSEGRFSVCQECGLIFDESYEFEIPFDDKYKEYKDSQLDYERSIRIRNSKAIQDPIIKQKYEKIQTLEKWYRAYETSFTEQKKTIELLKIPKFIPITNISYGGRPSPKVIRTFFRQRVQDLLHLL